MKHLVQSKIRTAYNSYLQSVLGLSGEESSNDTDKQSFAPKKLFSLIRNAKQDSHGVSPLKDKDSGVTSMFSENKDKATLLMQLPQHARNYYRSERYSQLLSNLNPDNAPGPDRIKPIVLKELREELAPIIQLLFQKSISTGKIPTDWTKANVSPVFKKGSKSDPANYRPISLTCILCKVMEHIIASKLTQHLNQHNILYDLQHGFRDRRSCETQLIQLVENLGRQLVKGKQVDIVLLDFSKAFDKVSHPKLLFKLSQHGVKGNTLNWIRAFLVGRTQAVVLEGESSTEVPVTSGVPQGSVLGPLLFLLYINDLPQNVQSQVRLFADDTTVYLTVDSSEDRDTLQADLDTLQEWERAWNMEFNPSKCQVLHITRSKQPLNTQYTLHNQVLEATDTAKYLGVTISKDLSWNEFMCVCVFVDGCISQFSSKL